MPIIAKSESDDLLKGPKFIAIPRIRDGIIFWILRVRNLLLPSG